MGPDNNSGPVVAYLDGQPVEIDRLRADGVTAEEAAATAERLAAIWGDMSVDMEVATESLREFFYSMALALAVQLAQIIMPELACRYWRTKKKRIRKKYEKRIMSWFWEMGSKCSD